MKFKEGTRRSKRELHPSLRASAWQSIIFPPARRPKRILADFAPLIEGLSEELREFVKFKEGTRRSQRGLHPSLRASAWQSIKIPLQAKLQNGDALKSSFFLR